MLDATFYDLLMEASNAMYQAMADARARSGEAAEPRPPILALRAGFAESPGWYLVQAAEFAPEPLTVEKLRVRDVYASESLAAALLEIMASEGWLDRAEAGTYALTEAGWAVLQRSRERVRRALEPVELLPAADLAFLLGAFERVIQASLASPTPPGNWCLHHSRNRAPADDSPPLVKLLHYFDDFNAFRDDAHMAAWQPLEPSGAVWEAFALVCSGEATNLEQVYDQLARRGNSRQEYAAALADLARRGWLAPVGAQDAYQVTEAGRTVREQVERLTDSYFYAPWSQLSEAEIARVHGLLLQMQAGMQEMSF